MLLIEADAVAARVIRDNIAALDLAGARVLASRVDRALARGPGGDPPRDVVFADPPYATTEAEVSAVLSALLAGGWLAPAAVVAVERATRSGPQQWPAGYAADRARRYGEATLWYGRAAGAAPAGEQADGGPSGRDEGR